MNSKSKMILRNIVALLALGSSQWANAQTDNSKNLGNEDIDIVKEYQPVLNDAFKISLTPQGDTSTSHAPSYTYNVEPQQMTPNFNITPIKPVKIKDEVIKKLYNGFIKVSVQPSISVMIRRTEYCPEVV